MKSALLPNFDFDRLKTFYAVISEGSFTRAAEVLGLDKSSVSRQVQLLEEELGRQLIVRSHRGVRLTSIGEFVFEKAQKVLDELRSIRGQLDMGTSDQLEGVFRLTTTHALSATWLTTFLDKFVALHPGLRFEILGSSEPLDLTTGEFDAAIRPYMDNSPHLVHELLMRWRLSLFASAEYLSRFGTPQTAEDLDDHRLIVFGDNRATFPRSYTSWPLYIGTQNGRIRKPFMVLNTVPGMYNLVASGLGIGCFAKESPVFKNYKLVPVLPELPGTDVEIYYIYSDSTKHFPKIRAFGEFLKGICKI